METTEEKMFIIAKHLIKNVKGIKQKSFDSFNQDANVDSSEYDEHRYGYEKGYKEALKDVINQLKNTPALTCVVCGGKIKDKIRHKECTICQTLF